MNRRIFRPQVAALLVTVTAVCSVVPAWAKQEYYDALSAGTGTCADCRLCHTGPVGNETTWDLSKPFTLYMSTAGRLGTIPDAVQDSDKDGATDLVELTQFGDPNDPMVGPGEFECPSGAKADYGCARVSTQAPHSTTWQWLAAGLVSLLFIRRRH